MRSLAHTKASNKHRKQVNRVQYDWFITSSDELSTRARPSGEYGPLGDSKDPRMRRGQAAEPVRNGTCLVVTSETDGLLTRHA